MSQICPNGRCERRPRGLTLLELVVVLGIVAMLLAILMPAVVRLREDSLSLRCTSNLRDIGAATAAYVAQSDGWMPRDAFSASNAFFAPCLALELALPAPDETITKKNGLIGPRVQVDPQYCIDWLQPIAVYKCPAVDRSDPHVLHYFINAVDFNWLFGTGLYRATPWQRMQSVPNAARTVYLAEGNLRNVKAMDIGGCKFSRPTDLPYALPPAANAGQPNTKQAVIAADDPRHGGRSPVLFFDGHVESRNLRSAGDWPLSLLNPYAP